MSTTAANPGQAQMEAYRTALRKRDFPAAIRELVAAIQADPRQNAPFPVGKYLPQRILRTEPAGVSFLCRHKDSADSVVVKTLNAEAFDRPMDAILADARVSQQVDHPVFIRVRDCGYVDAGSRNRPYIVTDYFDGIALDDYVMQNGPLPVPDMQELAVPLAAAMQAAHDQNLVHRNLRPQNVLVRRASVNAPWEVRLIDVGLGVRASAWGIFAAFAAPEQLDRINDPIGKPTDIYGFGKTCAHALFQTALPQLKHWKSIPVPLAEFLERCLAENPADRPSDFYAVSRCFSRIQSTATVPVIPTVSPIPTVTAMPQNLPPAARTGVSAQPRRAPAAPPPVSRRLGDDGLPDYQPMKKKSSMGLILAVVAGLLALLFLGILGIVLLATRGGGSGDTRVASTSPNGNDVTNADPPPIPPVGKRPKGGNADDGGRIGGFPNIPNFPNGGFPGNQGDPGDKVRRSFIVTFKGVPNQEMATFVEERLKFVLANEKDEMSRIMANEPAGPKGAVRGGVVFDGKDVTAAVQLNVKGRRSPQTVLNDLDLGLVTEAGENYAIEISVPPTQTRSPPEKQFGRKLTKQEVAIVISALRAGTQARRERDESLKALRNSDPSDEGRATIRSLLKATIQSEVHFPSEDAIRALGRWGTEEDVGFLTSAFPADAFGPKEHVVGALADLRSPKAADYLVKNLGNFFAGARCLQALRTIGTPAEKVVASYLTYSDPKVRVGAAQFLKDYGSGSSLKALQAAAKNNDKELSKAAWDAWKTIAYHNPKPAAVSDEGPPPVPPEKTITETLDDLTITTLSKIANELQSVALAVEGNGYYTHDRDGFLKRWPWEGGTSQAGVSIGKGAVMAVSSEGIFVASVGDARILDPITLEGKTTGAMDPVKFMSAATKSSLAVARCDTTTCIRVLDLSSFSLKQTLQDKNIRLFGKFDPTITSDGRFVFTREGGKLFRWVVTNGKMGFSESSEAALGAADGGQIVVSPDGRFVALFYADGNNGAAKVGTFVFAVGDLKRPAYTIAHGSKATALAFDNKGTAYVGSADGTLTRFDANGVKVKSYKLDGPARQILVAPKDDKLLILTDSKLLRVDLPK